MSSPAVDPATHVRHVGPGGAGTPPSGNALLRHLSPEDFAALAPHLERVPLEVGDMLAEAGSPIEWIWFLEGALAGCLDVLPDGRKLAIGIVGREGALGWPLLLGEDRWPWSVVLRAERTTAYRLPASVLLALPADAPLRHLILRFGACFVAQMSRTIVSNLIHSVERRAARWLLLYHDRLDGDGIVLTHEELGYMLGVRRASITTALHDLEGEGAIKGLRGRILVRDRARLEAIAGDTHGHAEAAYKRLIG